MNQFFNNEQYEEDEIEGYFEEEVEEIPVLNEALRRMEQAKLYEVLLKHQLFGPNSGRPEIVKIVQNEIQEFVTNRLQELLGMKPVQQQMSYGSQFSDQEVQALRDLAARILTKSNPAPSKAYSEPTISQVQATPAKQAPHPTLMVPKPQSAPQSFRQQPTPVANKKPVKRNGRRKSESVSGFAVENADGTITEVNHDYSQAVSQTVKPMAMPTQAMMDMINSENANRNAGSGLSSAGGNSEVAAALAKALMR